MKTELSRVLLTGANGGIGKALAVELLRRGASKVYVGGRSTAALAEVLASGDARLIPIILDVTDPDQITAAARRAHDVTLVINNAGYCSYQGTLAEEAIKNARREIDVNYVGALSVARAFASVISASGGGAIINVLSFLSLVALPQLGTYSASKAAALSMTHSLRAELAPRGIAVFAAMPAQVDTAMGSWWSGPKAAPAEVARDILDALEAGEEEMFPGALTREAASNFEANPRAFQARLLGLEAPPTTHNSAPTNYIPVDGVRFAYRRIGVGRGVPILLLQHFRGTMDWWDPWVTDGLGRHRPVILFDNRGVGLSEGETPTTVEAMARDAGAFIDAMKLSEVDLLGFSLGGYIAQELALSRPQLVRRVILAGTGPRGGEGMQEFSPEVAAAATSTEGRPFLFFAQSATSQAAARAFLARTSERKRDLDPTSTVQTMQAQGQALAEWGQASSNGGYLRRLRGFIPPTLVVNGSNDIMVPTINAFSLSQAIPNAELILYPDAGHAAFSQYAHRFVQHANLFLNRQ